MSCSAFVAKLDIAHMLGNRFAFDGQPVVSLNETQEGQRNSVAEKIRAGTYPFARVACVVCGGFDIESLSEKDRYGLYAPVGICRTCGLIQANPRMTEDSYRSFYEHDYRKLYVGSPAPTDEFFQRQKNHGRAILQYLESVEGGRHRPYTGRLVVEVGTGAGGILDAFRDAGNETFGVDLGSEYLVYGSSRGLNLHHGGLEVFMATGRKADLIIYSHVLEHVLNPVVELANVRSVLREEGLAYIEVPGVKALTHSYRQDFLRALQGAHTYYFTGTALQNCAFAAGLERITGDEEIRAVFRKGSVRPQFSSDYASTMRFLKGMEVQRLRSWNIHRVKASIRRVVLRVLASFGVLEVLKKWYYRIQHRRR